MNITHLISIGTGTRTLPIPPNVSYEVMYGHIIVTTDANTGNRRFHMDVVDSDGNVVTDVHAKPQQGASEVQHYALKQGMPEDTTFTAGIDLQLSISNRFFVPPNHFIEVFLENQQAGDVIEVNLVVDARHMGHMGG